MSQALNLPRSASRHPVTIGVLESVRALLFVAAAALLCASAAWFASIAEQQPITAIPVWAGSLLAVAGGWELSAGVGLPPTLLTFALLLVLRSAYGRTRRALEVNEDLARAGRIPAVQYAGPLGMGAVLLATAVWLGVCSLLIGESTPTPTGSARFLLVLAVPALFAVLGRSRRGPGPGRWAEELLDAVADRLGVDWARAAENGVRTAARTWAALGMLAVVLVALALVLRWSAAAEAVSAYSDPVAAAVGLGLVQLLYAPTVLVLGLAWTSGAGVQMSETLRATPFAGFDGPVPAIPVLTLVPPAPPAWSPALLGALVLAGAAAAVGRRAWAHELDWRSLVVHAMTIAASAAVLALFSTGAIGPEGLGRFGAPVGLFTLWVSGLAVAGTALGWGLRLLADRREG